MSGLCLDYRRMDLWPLQFFAFPLPEGGTLGHFRAWVVQNNQPLSTFMPDRIRGSSEHALNQANFRSFAHMLQETHSVSSASSRGAGNSTQEPTGSHRCVGCSREASRCRNRSLSRTELHSTSSRRYIFDVTFPRVSHPGAP